MIFILFIGLAFVLFFNQYMQNKKNQRDQAYFEKRKEQYHKLLASYRKDDKNNDSQVTDE